MLTRYFILYFKLPQQIRYLIIGLFNTIIGYAIFLLLYSSLNNKLHYNLILLSQYIITVNISYLNMKFLVFRTKENYKKEYIKNVITYISTYILNSLLLSSFLLMKINIEISQFIVLSIIAVIIYFIHKNINFKL